MVLLSSSVLLLGGAWSSEQQEWEKQQLSSAGLSHLSTNVPPVLNVHQHRSHQTSLHVHLSQVLWTASRRVWPRVFRLLGAAGQGDVLLLLLPHRPHTQPPRPGQGWTLASPGRRRLCSREDVLTVSPCLQGSSRLWWNQCLCVGDRVCVTSLRVCVLGGWRGNRVLAVSNCSEVHKDHSQTADGDAGTGSQQDTPTSGGLGACPAAGSQPTLQQQDTPIWQQDTPIQHHQDTPPARTSCVDDAEEADPQRSSAQTRIKTSRIISYQVTVRPCCAVIGCYGPPL